MITQRFQTTVRHGHGVLRLNGLIPSPYTAELNGIGPFRDIHLFPEIMKAIYGLDYIVTGGGNTYVGVAYFTGNSLTEVTNLQFDMPDAASATDVQTAAQSAVTTYAGVQGYTLSDGVFATSVMPSIRSFTNPTRSLNTAFQISTTQDAIVTYTVDIAASLSLSGGATGTVTLEYADDSGFTTNVKTVQSSVNGNSGTLTIGLGLTQTATASLNGVVPAGKYVKLVTANTTGTPTFTMRASQEVLI